MLLVSSRRRSCRSRLCRYCAVARPVVVLDRVELPRRTGGIRATWPVRRLSQLAETRGTEACAPRRDLSNLRTTRTFHAEGVVTRRCRAPRFVTDLVDDTELQWRYGDGGSWRSPAGACAARHRRGADPPSELGHVEGELHVQYRVRIDYSHSTTMRTVLSISMLSIDGGSKWRVDPPYVTPRDPAGACAGALVRLIARPRRAGDRRRPSPTPAAVSMIKACEVWCSCDLLCGGRATVSHHVGADRGLGC